MAIGFIRTPVFTRHFTPEEYGIYSIIYLTHSILAIFFFTWITNCLWRFYYKYQNQNKLNELYSNLFLLKIVLGIFFFVISMSWFFIIHDILVKKLIILLFLQLFSSGFVSYILVIFRIEGFAKRFNFIAISHIILQFSFQYFLAFYLKLRIESLPIGIFIVDFIFLIFLYLKYLKKIEIKLKFISKSIIKDLFSYASAIIISNLSILLLTSVDRYIIAIYGTIAQVGIYNQVYNISQMSMMAFVNLFFAIINPRFIKEMENNLEGTSRLTSLYITIYIMIALPIAVYFSLFSYNLSKILLGSAFNSGFTMIPFVMFSSFIYGITMFFEARIKFAVNFKKILMGFIPATILNIILNFICIPIFNYQVAAITTLISYTILFFTFWRFDLKINKFSFSGIKFIIPSIYILLLEILIHYTIKFFILENMSILFSIIEGIIFLILYIFVILKYSFLPILAFKKQYS